MDAKKKTAPAPVESITSFKGFDKNWQCRGFQYKIGESYEHSGPVNACKGGFHACEYPLDVFSYYSPASSNFAIVEQSGTLSRHDEDSKVASSSLTVKASIGLPGLITAAFEYVTKRCDPANAEHATGDSSASSATGYSSASSATGYRSASSATGDRSASLTTGWDSSSEIKLDDDPDKNLNAVAVAVGGESKARAPLGCAIVLANRDDDGNIIHIRASKVGDNGIKAGVWYSLDANGEFVEVES